MGFLRIVRPRPKMERARLAAAAVDWLTYLRDERRLKPTSILTYRSSLTQFLRELPEEYAERDLRAALEVRLGPQASSHVRRSSFMTLSHFFGWAEDRHGWPNPLANAAVPVAPDVRRRCMTRDELDLLGFRLKAAHVKDRCEVLLMLHQGFRVGDVVNLKVADIDWGDAAGEGARIRARVGKGGRDQWLPMGPSVAAALRGYLTMVGISEGYVFCGPRGRMTIRAVWKAWRRVAGPQLAHLKPHQLRHTYANYLLRGDAHADVHTVMKLMRHRNLAVTQLYLSEDSVAERGAILSLDAQLGAFGDRP